eukprot:CAMPEP_0113538762 /NCGR_PEP_ID=MMETSP0015_2-20120614/7546_1 /TAXON_ID=2838 /ORGANISM="Odontella" /LENGTH=156 /DNA_ID=CAMNT_0000438373 /DNA_START=1264 /DNA_END=1734 /DNA_ORIENTATION=+ /assembly_acc=CAM_ASM_000160
MFIQYTFDLLLSILMVLLFALDTNTRVSATSLKSPKVTSIAWGSICVEGAKRCLKNAMCYPGGSKKWSKHGTRHRQGIALSDIDDLLDAGAQIIILSSGMDKRVHVQGENLKRLKELKSNNDIDDFEILPTKQAVMQYNELAEEEKLVGTLFHSTC